MARSWWDNSSRNTKARSIISRNRLTVEPVTRDKYREEIEREGARTCLYHLSHHPCLRIGGTQRSAREETALDARCCTLSGGVTRLFPRLFLIPPRRTLEEKMPASPFRSHFLRVRAANERKSPKNNCHRRVPRRRIPPRSITIESRWMETWMDRERRWRWISGNEAWATR